MVKNHYEIIGLKNPESSPLILMVHGAGGDLHHYKTVTSTLVEQGYRVLLIDVRYHGLSQPKEDDTKDPGKTSWTFDDVLQDVDTMLTDIKEKHYQGVDQIQLFIAGLSMGGMIALLYAEKESKRKREDGIHLAGIIPIASGIPHLEIPRLGWDLYAERRATLEDLTWTRSAIIQSSITPYGQDQTRRAMELISNHALYECLVAIATMLPNPSNPPVSYTVRSKLPTLLLIPEQDVLTKPEMELLYQLCVEQGVNAERAYIQNAGHMVILDQGEQVGKHISAFCKRIIHE
ncbi:Golgi apyrase [Mucor velutinosus]|uniref:Golgi apyrase n=1 Tax=Mucor velutinosus TaxID=708070 RepID=A0AAN7D8F0_9FUNG|nr:Golgi apyrase [Mucor velutinosus]